MGHGSPPDSETAALPRPNARPAHSAAFEIAGRRVRRGETLDLRMEVSQSYVGNPVALPIRVVRAKKPGPTVFVTAAVHGDEINGTGIVHELMFHRPLKISAGTVVFAPVIDVFGFEIQTRYMPDRRDLNRCFPGIAGGSLSSRVADTIFREIVLKCDYGIDLHSAASGRTNFPNVRADLTVPGARRLADAFGCELVVNGKGPPGSLRHEACKAGVPTIILEAGEVSKIEPAVLEIGHRGVRNALIDLGIVEGEPQRPAYQTRVTKTTWVRANVGGILRFHVAPGDPVDKGQPIATNFSVFGETQNVIVSPSDGIVLGMTTLPVVKPGEPICHVALPGKSIKGIREALSDAGPKSLDRRVRRDLATNLTVTAHTLTDADLA